MHVYTSVYTYPMDIGSFVPAWLSLDWIIVLVAALIIAADAMRSGSGRASTLALAFPLAAFALAELPKAVFLGPVVANIGGGYAGAVVFGALVAVFYFFVRRIIGLWGDDGGPGPGLAAGIGCTAVLVVIWLQVPALNSLWHFGPQIQLVFGEAYRLWWLLGSLAALAYARG